MEKEFNLSDYVEDVHGDNDATIFKAIHVGKVKKFIKQVENGLGFDVREDDEIIPVFQIKKVINTFAGDKLK